MKLYLLIFALFYSCFVYAQAKLSNSCNIYIKSSTCFSLAGNYYNCLQNGNLGNISNFGTLKLTGNWYNNTATILDLSSCSGSVMFCGSSCQSIGGSTHSTLFKDIVISNPAGVAITNNVTIGGILSLNNGVLSTGSNVLNLLGNSSVSPLSGSATSFIDGKVNKTGNNSSFIFPVGDVQGLNVVWAPVEISAWDNSNDFTVQYCFKSPFDSLIIPTWNTGSNLGDNLNNVSGVEFWLIEKHGVGNQFPNVKLHWKDAVRSQFANSGSNYEMDALEDIALVHWNGSLWENLEGTAVAGIWPAGYIQNFINFSSYSPITFGSKTGKNPLPIELLDFNANCNNNNVIIYWQTASETNNCQFILERCSDFQNWKIITTANGAGNSSQLLQYNYVDTGILGENIYYYRLGSVDFNGVIEYSSVISANCVSNNIESISVYPNPIVDGILHCSIYSVESAEFVVSIVGILGRELLCKKINIEKGLTYFNLDITNLNNSLYYIYVKSSNGYYKACKQILLNK